VKIYTRTGDAGETGLFGGGRVAKDHPRVEAMGEVDELNASIGWALTQVQVDKTHERLESVQHDLFAIGAELATPPPEPGRTRPETPAVDSQSILRLERWIDEATAELSELRAFVLPGGTAGAAALHLARTEDAVGDHVLIYLNRLSDLLFTLARLENKRAGTSDIQWKKV
jgi:cob(I)alamin adenosyltransferase